MPGSTISYRLRSADGATVLTAPLTELMLRPAYRQRYEDATLVSTLTFDYPRYVRLGSGLEHETLFYAAAAKGTILQRYVDGVLDRQLRRHLRRPRIVGDNVLASYEFFDLLLGLKKARIPDTKFFANNTLSQLVDYALSFTTGWVRGTLAADPNLEQYTVEAGTVLEALATLASKTKLTLQSGPALSGIPPAGAVQYVAGPDPLPAARLWLGENLLGLEVEELDDAGFSRVQVQLEDDSGLETARFPAYDVPLVKNMGFENGSLLHWSAFGTFGAGDAHSASTLGPKFDAKHYRLIKAGANNVATGVQQTISLVPGESYVLVGSMHVPAHVSGFAHIDVFEAGVLDLSNLVTGANSGYVFFAEQFTYPAGGNGSPLLRVFAYAAGTANINLELRADNVLVVPSWMYEQALFETAGILGAVSTRGLVAPSDDSLVYPYAFLKSGVNRTGVINVRRYRTRDRTAFYLGGGIDNLLDELGVGQEFTLTSDAAGTAPLKHLRDDGLIAARGIIDETLQLPLTAARNYLLNADFSNRLVGGVPVRWTKVGLPTLGSVTAQEETINGVATPVILVGSRSIRVTGSGTGLGLQQDITLPKGVEASCFGVVHVKAGKGRLLVENNNSNVIPTADFDRAAIKSVAKRDQSGVVETGQVTYPATGPLTDDNDDPTAGLQATIVKFRVRLFNAGGTSFTAGWTATIRSGQSSAGATIVFTDTQSSSVAAGGNFQVDYEVPLPRGLYSVRVTLNNAPSSTSQTYFLENVIYTDEKPELANAAYYRNLKRTDFAFNQVSLTVRNDSGASRTIDAILVQVLDYGSNSLRVKEIAGGSAVASGANLTVTADFSNGVAAVVPIEAENLEVADVAVFVRDDDAQNVNWTLTALTLAANTGGADLRLVDVATPELGKGTYPIQANNLRPVGRTLKVQLLTEGAGSHELIWDFCSFADRPTQDVESIVVDNAGLSGFLAAADHFATQPASFTRFSARFWDRHRYDPAKYPFDGFRAGQVVRLAATGLGPDLDPADFLVVEKREYEGITSQAEADLGDMPVRLGEIFIGLDRATAAVRQELRLRTSRLATILQQQRSGG